jgi:hypothetical protein
MNISDLDANFKIETAIEKDDIRFQEFCEA